MQCGRFELNLERPLVMGILNVTPDSFSDGAPLSLDQTLSRAERMIKEGADLLDIGGESTRPGAEPVSPQEELDRVLPVLYALRDCGIPLSVDTCKPEVMSAALNAGADMINDILALQAPGAIDAVAASRCGVCIMHMQGEPRTMQAAPQYDDVVKDVQAFLAQRVQALEAAGIASNRVVLDPGFGFGKTPGQNYTLLRHLDCLSVGHYPWLVGVSRKSMIGHVVGREPSARLAGSLAAALYGLEKGARILRVHDVERTVDAVKVWQAIKDESFV